MHRSSHHGNFTCDEGKFIENIGSQKLSLVEIAGNMLSVFVTKHGKFREHTWKYFDNQKINLMKNLIQTLQNETNTKKTSNFQKHPIFFSRHTKFLGPKPVRILSNL